MHSAALAFITMNTAGKTSAYFLSKRRVLKMRCVVTADFVQGAEAALEGKYRFVN